MTAKGERAKAVIHVVLGSILVSVACYIAIRFGQARGVSIVLWPGDGILLALMLGPSRRLPWTMLIVGELSIFAFTYTLADKHAFWSHGFEAIFLDVVTLMRVGLTYWLVKWLLGSSSPTQSKNLVVFLCAAMASTSISAALKGVLFAAEHQGALLDTLVVSMAATMAGYAVITPAMLVVTEQKLTASFWLSNPRSLLIVSLFVPLIYFVCWQSHYPLLFIVPLALMAIAYSVDRVFLALATLATCGLILGLFLTGHGPVYLIKGSPSERLLFMQFFLVIITATTFPIAALMAEHARLKASLIGARIEAEAANQAKSVFLATMSHEIRTPLNGVLGMAQAIAMGDLPPPQRERLQVLHRSGETLLAILNDVLDLSKIEAGKLTLESIEFDLDEVLKGAIQNYALLAEEKGLTLHVDMGDAAGVYLGDPTRLRQIVYNLVSNALKFTSAGSVSLSARFDQGRLMIEVRDTGVGIAADKLSKLFVKFSQVDASTTRNFGGTGLGLSICRELSELMGGRIVVTSVEGQGSAFTLELPLMRIGEARGEVAETVADARMPDEQLRVLAAEDNPTNRLVLKTLLDFAGVQLTLVENGAEAVQAWADQAWDLILMDVQMPVMDGPSAAREIRRREAQTQRPRTPIVALTANTMSHQIAEYIDAGMDLYLPKPIEVDRLFELLATCCGLEDAVSEQEAQEVDFNAVSGRLA